MDVHNMLFHDEVFDTVIDTFGLECSYNVDRALTQMKRVLKVGGKLILLERGIGVWLLDNA